MTTALTNTLYIAADAIRKASTFLCPKEVLECLSLIDSCHNRRSKVLISGVGKSGIVARKIASTFSSIGIMSVYINPLDALHGDIGVMHSSDICLLISNSGKTNELIDLIIHVKKQNVKVISIVGDITSPIAKESDAVLAANIDKESCPLNLAPTASTTVALAIGDAIAIEWMRNNNISVDDFAINHPAGSLGKRISMRVEDLMIPKDKLHFLSTHDSLDAILKVITKDGIGTCCILDQIQKDKLIGIITDGDLRRSLKNNPSEKWVELNAQDIMTKDPIIIGPSNLAIEALEMMEKIETKLINVLPVINKEKGTFIGIIRLHDLIQAGLK